MFVSVLQSLWYFLPAGLANACPIPISKCPVVDQFNTPLDFNRSFNGKRLLGQNKTIRGVVAAWVTGIVFVYLQVYLYQHHSFFQTVSLIDYNKINPIVLGSLLGLGAIMGDSIKSFFKRQLNITPGNSWIPFDQVDYIVGGLIFSLPYTQQFLVSTFPFVQTFVIWIGLHFISTFIGYKLKLRSKPI